jgi:hypothetical protein
MATWSRWTDIWGSSPSIKPWRLEVPGLDMSALAHGEERTVRTETPAGTLIARWALGPDGDWWQTEYPVKGPEDLPAALVAVKARSYVLDTARLVEGRSEVGRDGILALELPRRPYSDLLHEFLGWSDGLMLLGEPAVQEMLAILEDKLQQLVEQVARLPGEVILSPDNLDGQFVSPRAFRRHLAPSYARSSEVLHQWDKQLLVHVGGPIRHLLESLAESGVDGVEGIAGPPQSNATLAEARAIAGPGLVLWGGIPQDLLVSTFDDAAFAEAVVKAALEARGDGQMIVGVADRVPVDADLRRLEAIPALIKRALQQPEGV